MTQKIRCHGSEVGENIVTWLRANRAAAKLVVIEGMRGAGKSRALTYVAAQWPSAVNSLSLDDLIPKGALDESEDWTQGVLRHGGEVAINDILEKSGLALIEGPAAWRVLTMVSLPDNLEPVRIYIKRMTTAGGLIEWLDIKTVELIPRSSTDPLANLDRYHRDERPDLCADLIIERLDYS